MRTFLYRIRPGECNRSAHSFWRWATRLGYQASQVVRFPQVSTGLAGSSAVMFWTDGPNAWAMSRLRLSRSVKGVSVFSATARMALAQGSRLRATLPCSNSRRASGVRRIGLAPAALMSLTQRRIFNANSVSRLVDRPGCPGWSLWPKSKLRRPPRSPGFAIRAGRCLRALLPDMTRCSCHYERD